MGTHDISVHPIHLGLGATADIEPLFTGAMDWYADYTNRHARDGVDGRLVSMHTFNESWGMWEMHPQGSEVVLCTSGTMILHQESPDGAASTVTLRPANTSLTNRGPGIPLTWSTKQRRCS